MVNQQCFHFVTPHVLSCVVLIRASVDLFSTVSLKVNCCHSAEYLYFIELFSTPGFFLLGTIPKYSCCCRLLQYSSIHSISVRSSVLLQNSVNILVAFDLMPYGVDLRSTGYCCRHFNKLGFASHSCSHEAVHHASLHVICQTGIRQSGC